MTNAVHAASFRTRVLTHTHTRTMRRLSSHLVNAGARFVSNTCGTAVDGAAFRGLSFAQPKAALRSPGILKAFSTGASSADEIKRLEAALMALPQPPQETKKRLEVQMQLIAALTAAGPQRTAEVVRVTIAVADTLLRTVAADGVTSKSTSLPTALQLLLNAATMLLSDLENPAEAEALLRRALRLIDDHMPAGDVSMAEHGHTARLLLASALDQQVKAAESEEVKRGAVKRLAIDRGGGHRDTLATLFTLGVLVHQRAPDDGEAELLLRAALPGMVVAGGTSVTEEEVRLVRTALVDLLLGHGRREEAVRLLTEGAEGASAAAAGKEDEGEEALDDGWTFHRLNPAREYRLPAGEYFVGEVQLGRPNP